jgi:VWFA-related protein
MTLQRPHRDRRRGGAAILLFVAALLLAGPARPAQEPATVVSVPPGVVFGEQIDVRAIDVEAVVTARDGKLVHGLTAADFRLLVDGQEVTIDHLTEVADGTTAAPAGGESPTASAPLPPGEPVARSYLVFVDEVFTIAANRDAALRKLAGDLRLLRPGDRMAVLAFDGAKLAVLADWTGDPAALAAALARAEKRPARGNMLLAQQRSLAADRDQIVENDLREVIDFEAQIELTHRASPDVLAQLGRSSAAAAAALRGFPAPPGRKVMLYLSGGWPVDASPQLFLPLLEAANRLGYTLYPIESATLQTAAINNLDALAVQTGGRAGSASGADFFRAAIADSGSYYWLGFSPSGRADDRRHRLQVEVRRPDLTVRTRKGFFDLSRQAVTAMRAEGRLLFGGAAAESGLRIEAGAVRAAGRGRMELPVTLWVPVEALLLRPVDQGFVAEAPIAVAALDAKGGRADLPRLGLRVAFPQPPPAGGFARLRFTLTVRRAAQRLAFTVADRVSGGVLSGQLDVHP